MPVRRNANRQRSLADLVESLPARFREDVEVYAESGAMTALAAYISDLSEHLSRELGTENPPTVEVMTALGIPPSEWYRVLLTQPTTT